MTVCNRREKPSGMAHCLGASPEVAVLHEVWSSLLLWYSSICIVRAVVIRHTKEAELSAQRESRDGKFTGQILVVPSVLDMLSKRGSLRSPK